MEILKRVVQFVIVTFAAFVMLMVNSGKGKESIDKNDVVYGGIISILATVIVYTVWWAFG